MVAAKTGEWRTVIHIVYSVCRGANPLPHCLVLHAIYTPPTRKTKCQRALYSIAISTTTIVSPTNILGPSSFSSRQAARSCGGTDARRAVAGPFHHHYSKPAHCSPCTHVSIEQLLPFYIWLSSCHNHLHLFSGSCSS